MLYTACSIVLTNVLTTILTTILTDVLTDVLTTYSVYCRLEYYPTTVVIVSIIVLTYVVLAAVSYMADRKCPVQERVIPIQDNSSTDTQRYIITLETGSEPGSGTTAKVRPSPAGHLLAT